MNKQKNFLPETQSLKRLRKSTLAWALGVLVLSTSCAIDDHEDIIDEEEAVDTAFTEGIVEMGMFTHGIDIGHYIKNIDFTREDTREQLEELIAEAGPGNDLLSHFQRIGEQNPMAVLALMFNTVISDYHIKDDIVLGQSRGFGFIYNHLHDQSKDQGKIYMESLTSTQEIPEADRKIYVEYVPSEQAAVSPNTSFDAELFDRQLLPETESVSGYECSVSVYTLKAEYAPSNPDYPMATPLIQKLVVYTSPLFSKTINFTHPFYMPEEGGILRIDMYMDNGEQPTLEMRPYRISPEKLNNTQLEIETAEPVYTIDDVSWGFKALSIFMSGWGSFGE